MSIADDEGDGEQETQDQQKQQNADGEILRERSLEETNRHVGDSSVHIEDKEADQRESQSRPKKCTEVRDTRVNKRQPYQSLD